MATIESLNAEIAQQNTLCQTLVKQNGEPSALEEAKKKLGELKKSLGVLNKAAGGGKDAKKKERLLLKTAKVCPLSSIDPFLNAEILYFDFRVQGTMVLGRCSAENTLKE